MSDLIAYKSNALVEASYKLTLQERVPYTHLRAHETEAEIVCRLLLEIKHHTQSFITKS